MARSYQDLLAKAREQVPEVQVADLAARRAAGDAPLVDGRPRAVASGTRATSPARCTSRAATSRAASPASRRPDQEIVLSCAVGQPLAAGRHARCRRWATTTCRASPAGSTRWKQSGQRLGRPATLTPEQRSRYSRHIAHPRDRRGRASSTLLGCQGAPDRRRRPRLAGGLLPGRGRGGHHRPGGRRRRGRQQPAAPDHPHHRPRGHAQGRVGADRDRGAQPRRRGQRRTRSGWTRRTSST